MKDDVLIALAAGIIFIVYYMKNGKKEKKETKEKKEKKEIENVETQQQPMGETKQNDDINTGTKIPVGEGDEIFMKRNRQGYPIKKTEL